MPRIHKLSDAVVALVKAGEVIIRPASVIKELVENSVDAHSKNVDIYISEGGMRFIRIVDDGDGMSREDAEMCLHKHTTSKLNDVNDLLALETLGFRGEALSSIVHVSKVKLITKSSDDNLGTCIAASGGLEGMEVSSVAAQKGTDITVEDLFYAHLPRRKSQKSPAVEMKEIHSLVSKFILAYPEVRFRVLSDSKLRGFSLTRTFSSGGDSSLLNNAAHLLGEEIARELRRVDLEIGDVSLSGYISGPSLRLRNGGRDIYVTINGRMLLNTSEFIKRFKGNSGNFLQPGEYPCAILHFKMPKDSIDVNIHPQKSEIGILNGEVFNNVVRKLIQNVFLMTENPSEGLNFPEFRSEGAPATEPRPLFPPQIDKKEEVVDNDFSDVAESPSSDAPVFSSRQISEPFNRVMLPRMEALFQIGKSIIVAKSGDDLYAIEQHGAHERILFERYLDRISDGKLPSKPLLFPLPLRLSDDEKSVISANIDSLSNIGFDLQPFEDNGFQCVAIPDVFGRDIGMDDLMSIIRMIRSGISGQSVAGEAINSILKSIACHEAIKKNSILAVAAMQKVLDELLGTKCPMFCIHGRTVVKKIGFEELMLGFQCRIK